MRRRDLLTAGSALAFAGLAGARTLEGQESSVRFPLPPPLPFKEEKSGLKITAIRPVTLEPKRPLPKYQPTAGSWNTTDVEIANPLSIYPRFKPRRSLFYADDLGPLTVDGRNGQGDHGLWLRRAGRGVRRRAASAQAAGRRGSVRRSSGCGTSCGAARSTTAARVSRCNAISAVDNALWDIVGKALKTPVYKLLGGRPHRERVPCYCTGNNIEQAVEFGFKKLKLAIPHGPADGEAGLKTNEQLVQRARKLLGPDGEVMLDCWMAFTEDYTEELAARLAPYRVYWMEECLMPDDYAGMGRLNAKIKSNADGHGRA